MRARWISRAIFNDMNVHSLHMSGSQRHSARLNLRNHAFCAPVIRKEILDRAEDGEQYFHLYDPDKQDAAGNIIFYRYCSEHILTVAKGFYLNFSQPKFFDSAAACALRELTLPVHLGHFPLPSLGIPCVLVSSIIQFH